MAKLYFRYGAMDCGKTIHLLAVAHNYEERGQKVCVIKSRTDTKNGTALLSRIGVERATDFTFTNRSNLYKAISERYSDVACVLVDEAQFLMPRQVDQLLQVTIELNIPVICYGLRLNFRQTDKGFEGATRLLQLAHDIEELKTVCECGKKATQNARFLNGKFVLDGPEVLIDDGSTKIEYRSLCPKCYYKYRMNPNWREEEKKAPKKLAGRKKK